MLELSRDQLANDSRLALLAYLRDHGHPDAVLVDGRHPFIRLESRGAPVEFGIHAAPRRSQRGRVDITISCRLAPWEAVSRGLGSEQAERLRLEFGRYGGRQLAGTLPHYGCFDSASGGPHERLWKRATLAVAAVTAGLPAWQERLLEEIHTVIASNPKPPEVSSFGFG